MITAAKNRLGSEAPRCDCSGLFHPRLSQSKSPQLPQSFLNRVVSFAANGHLIGQVLNSDVHEPFNQCHWPAFPLEPVGDVLNLKGDLLSNEVFKQL